MQRVFCDKCKSWTLVIDGRTACCDTKIEFRSKKIKVICEPMNKRRQPSPKEKKEILENQNYKCIYCQKKFGTLYIKKGKKGITKIHWDHFIPFAYSRNNYAYNFVAACNICNEYKYSLLFQTLEEAQIYLLNKINEEGIIWL